jgi:outer membrane protein assembly factor BamB
MTRLASLFIALGVIFALAQASASDWARFRGPNGSGIASGTLPAIDPQHPLWKVAIPGKGVSSPIIVGGKLFLQTAAKDGKSRTLLCLDASNGKTLWTKEEPGEPAQPKKIHTKNSLASSTPASDGQQVYCVWWDGAAVSLKAYDMEGHEKWQASLGGWDSQHGPGSSPVIHDGLVFVNVDDDNRAELLALDAKTGDKKWIANRKHERACYTTPYVLKRSNRPDELILGTTHLITSYEPATGKINWEYPLVWPRGSMPLRVIGHPVYAGGLLVMSCGDGNGSRYMIAIDPEKKTPAKVWDLNRGSLPYVPCMLVRGDLLFWIGDKPGGWACCVEAKTGHELFTEKVTDKEPSSSPIMVGDQILMIAENGEIVVFKAGKEFEESSRVKLGEGVFASPALADGRLYIRGTTHLYCFGK